MKMKNLWHKLSIADVFKKTNSSELGLHQHEVGLRLEKYGPNKLVEKKKRKPITPRHHHQKHELFNAFPP
jgi:magnesium-transporting ATPase (P-type)